MYRAYTVRPKTPITQRIIERIRSGANRLNYLFQTKILRKKVVDSSIVGLSQKTKRRDALLYAALILLVLSPFVYLLLNRPAQTEAAWWDEGWMYRRLIEVNNPGSSALTDFQVSFTLDTASLITANKMGSACQDIRITDYHGNILPHWIEDNNPGCNDANTVIWVNLSNIPIGGTNIYVYYGNQYAMDIQNGNEVFEFYEDVETFNGWVTIGSGVVSQSSTRAFSGTYSAYKTTNSGSNGGYIGIGKTLGRDIVLEFWVNRNSAYSGGGADRVGLVNDSGDGYGWVFSHGGSIQFDTVSGFTLSAMGSAESATSIVDQWVKGQFIIASDDNIISRRYVGGTLNGENSVINSTYNSFSNFYISGGHDYWVDQITIRKFAADEPITNVSGTEDVGPGPILWYKFDEGQGRYAYNSGIGGGAPNITSNLMGYWSMNDNVSGSGQTITDSSGNNNHGTTAGSGINCTGAGISDRACLFNGTDDRISIPHNTWQTTGLQDGFTISAWIRPNSDAASTNARIIDKTTATNGANGFFVLYNAVADNVGFRVNNGVTVSSETDSITKAQWNHVSVVVNSNATATWYVNGQQSGAPSATSALTGITTSNALCIGNRSAAGACNTDRTFEGSIDEVYFHTKLLNSNEIDYLSNLGHTNAVLGNATCQPGEGSCPTWETEDMCVSGKCLKFDGVNDIVQTNQDLSWTSSDSFSFLVWVNSKEAKTSTILGKGLTGSSWEYSLRMTGSGTTPNFIYWNTSGSTGISVSASNAIGINHWHHIAVTYDGSSQTIRIYVDGFLKNSSSGVSGTFQDRANGLNIGRAYHNANQSGEFNGLIDEVKVYNYARTSDQIESDYIIGASNKGSSAVFGAQDMRFLSDGLVGHWKMDEASWNGTSGEVIDSSGNDNHGTGLGSASITAGRFGRGGNFNGTTSYVDIGDVHDMGTDDFTTSLWFRTTDTDGSLIAKSFPGSLEGRWFTIIQFGSISSTMESNLGTSTASTASAPYTNGEWHHLATVYDRSGNLNLYLNGELKDSTDISAHAGFDMQTNCSLFIGRYNDSSDCTNPLGSSLHLAGTIDDVRIYRRALSQQEVEQLYNWAPGPLGHWKLDDNNGSNAIDSGTGGNNGVLVNSPEWVPGKYGSGLRFNGSTNYVNLGPSLQPQLPVTINSWVYLANIPTVLGGIFNTDKTIGTPHNHSGIWMSVTSSGQISAEYGNNTSCGASSRRSKTSSATLSAGNWYHISSIIRGATDMDIFINGVNAGGTYTGSGSALVYLGRDAGIGSTPNCSTGDALSFPGIIDDVQLYDYELTQKQLANVMNGRPVWAPAIGSPIGSAVGHWKFDEGYGTTARNSGSFGSAINGTLVNMASPATAVSGWTNDGIRSRALNFDGVNDHVSIPNNSSINFAYNEDFTVSVWVNAASIQTDTGNPDNSILEKWSSGAVGYPYVIRYSNQTSALPGSVIVARYDVTNNPTITSTKTLSDQTWHHIVFTKVGSELYLYIDGELDGVTTDTTVGTTTNSSNLFIGQRGNNINRFRGSIDELKIYNYGFNIEEVLLEYNMGKTTVLGSTGTAADASPTNSMEREYCVPGSNEFCAPPVGEWLFEENTGTTAFDTSGNANNGSLVDSPLWVPGKEGSALGFRQGGVDNSVQISNSPSFEFPGGIYTLSVWVNPSEFTSTRQAIIDNHEAAENRFRLFVETPGSNGAFKIINDAAFAATGVTSPTGLLQIGRWSHIAAVVNGTEATLYHNGLAVASGSISQYQQGAINIGIGNKPTGSGSGIIGFRGRIDNVRIYDYARTTAQVAWEYNRGGPIGHWKLDECQGSTVHDSSGHGHHGNVVIGGSGSQTAVGTCETAGTAWGNGKVGRINSSMSFDGTDDYIEVYRGVTIPEGLDLANKENYTVSAWLNIKENVTTNAYLGFGNSANDIPMVWMETRDGTNEIRFGHRDNSGASSILDLSLPASFGEWFHVTHVRDGDLFKTYYNGMNLGNHTQGSIGSTSVDTLAIGALGRISYGQFTNGLIDDVRIYNYSLTEVQIREIMNFGAVRFE